MLALIIKKVEYTMKKKTLNKKLLIALGVLLAIIIVIFVYQNYKPEIDVLIHPVPHEKEILLHMIRAHGIANSLLLLGLIAVLNSIPGLSNSVICILSGLCYGPFFGLIIYFAYGMRHSSMAKKEDGQNVKNETEAGENE